MERIDFTCYLVACICAGLGIIAGAVAFYASKQIIKNKCNLLVDNIRQFDKVQEMRQHHYTIADRMKRNDYIELTLFYLSIFVVVGLVVVDLIGSIH